MAQGSEIGFEQSLQHLERAGKGSSILVETEGSDADAALAAILALIADKFGEGE